MSYLPLALAAVAGGALVIVGHELGGHLPRRRRAQRARGPVVPPPAPGGHRPAEKHGGVWAVPRDMPIATDMAPAAPAPAPLVEHDPATWITAEQLEQRLNEINNTPTVKRGADAGRERGQRPPGWPQEFYWLLSDDELAAIDTTAELASQLSDVVDVGRTRDADLTELVHHLHAIQHAIMAQAAGRAYPDRFRLLGSTIAPGRPLPTEETQTP